MNSRPDIELRIHSDPRHLCVARAAVCAAVEKIGFEEQACAKVMLAVDEAVSNIIRHGYNGRRDGPIWLSFRSIGTADQPEFELVIEDEARQVDLQAIHGRDLEDIRPGGLGVHIIQQVMDHVQYSHRPQGGMRLVMTKAACCQTPQSAKKDTAST